MFPPQLNIDQFKFIKHNFDIRLDKLEKELKKVLLNDLIEKGYSKTDSVITLFDISVPFLIDANFVVSGSSII